jgi:V8-like Glu-specific endopeptidase
MATQSQVNESSQEEPDDLSTGGSVSTATAPTRQTGGTSGGTGESQFVRNEVEGDAVVPTPPSTPGDGEAVSTDAYNEYGSPATTEAAQVALEATQAQITAAESESESAIADLAGIPGFEAPATGQESGRIVEPALREAGTAIAPGREAGEEEFGFLAALVPTLISSVGPAIARGVISRLSPKTQAAIPRVARTVTSAIGPARPLGGAPTAPAPTGGGHSNLLALLAQLLQSQAAKSTGEAVAVEADPLAEQAARVLEVIIGNDDRVRIERTTDVPWRRYCALRITFPKGVFRGTGFLIGPRAVATAGHCVYMHDQGGWARSVADTWVQWHGASVRPGSRNLVPLDCRLGEQPEP